MPDTGTLAILGFAEPFSSISHLAGAAVFAGLAWPLVRRGRGDAGRVASLAVFAFSCVLLLATSGAYHLLAPGGGRAVLQRLDHAAIFVLIAATFTPAHAILFRGAVRVGVLLFIWAAAAAAITLKTVFFDETPEALGLGLYLALGWSGALSAAVVWRRYGTRFVMPLLLGAVAYTLGGVLEFLRRPTFLAGVLEAHEVFHVAVLAGVAFHWRFVASFAAGPPGPVREATPGALEPLLTPSWRAGSAGR